MVGINKSGKSYLLTFFIDDTIQLFSISDLQYG
ncbi:hypothetical protein C8N37_106411 [Sphingobacterium faecium]|nr:hypothetical protein C8N37_106411 [Sphingobacterium faecium]